MDDDFVDDFVEHFVKDKNQIESKHVEAENLIERERVEAENLIERERVEAENIINNALNESKNILGDAVRENENRINHAVVKDKNLKDIALIEIKNMKEDTKEETEHLKKMTTVSIEHIKNMIKTESDNRAKYAKIVSDNIKQKASVTTESLKQKASVTAESLKQKASVTAESLKQTASVTTESLKQTASVTAESLKQKASVTAESLKQTASVTAESLKQTASVTAESLKQTALVMSQNVKANVDVALENMRKTAHDTKDNSLNHAKNYDLQTTKNTSNIIEQSRHTTFSKKILSQNKKQLIVIVTMIVIITSVGTLYVVNPHYSQSSPTSFSTNYLIQNLKGDTVNTWVSWKKPNDGLFHVHVQNSQYATKERLDAILDVIMSQKKIELDNSLINKGLEGTRSIYYAGWYGALNSITKDTKFNIVKNLHFHLDDVPTGDIMINLVALSNPDGYSAYTNSIIDEQNHQILKSTITVYNIDKISLEDLKTLVRHELGHGFGLAHSTAPEDLMAPVITTNYPYISQCDLDAITHLYDGGQTSKVVCET